MSEKPLNESTQPLKEENLAHSKIDVIKELIFGNNMKEYAHEFNEIKSLIAQNKEQTDHNLSEAKNDIFDALEEFRKDMNRQLDELQLNMNREIDRLDDIKTDRSLLVNLFSDMAKKIEG
mgnify:CR=1 FL=1